MALCSHKDSIFVSSKLRPVRADFLNYLDHMELNNSQRLAVHHGSGPMLVIAGPGSGKTAVIISRIRHLVYDLGIDPASILAVTFSRKAAKEMEIRYHSSNSSDEDGAHFTNSLCGKEPRDDGDVTFATLHSIFLKILSDGSCDHRLRIISNIEKNDFLRSEIISRNLSSGDLSEDIRTLLTKISKTKSHALADESPPSAYDFHKENDNMPRQDMPKDDIFHDIFLEYQAFLKNSGCIDFDDIIIMCFQMLKKDISLLKKWQSRYRYILVDEFQDVSPIQYEIIKLLAGDDANLFAVGDDDQSIYGFRGATGAALSDFVHDYPWARKVSLDINYRCAPQIVSASRRLIDQNTSRISKNIISAAQPGSLSVTRFQTRVCEYETIIKKISSICREETTAVLFRTNADHALLSRMLANIGISFSCQDSPHDFTDLFFIRDIISYMKIACCLRKGSKEPCRGELLQIINRPSRYISTRILSAVSTEPDIMRCISLLKNAYFDKLQVLTLINEFERHLIFISDMSPLAAIKYIRHAVGYDAWLLKYAASCGAEPAAWQNTLDMFEEYSEMHSSTEAFLHSLSSHHAGENNGADSDTGSKSNLHIMTMHASKGMEFDNVILPDVNESVIPGKRAICRNDIEEERRLFYVAMTRAKHALYISYVDRLHNKRAYPSRFLDKL